MTLPNFTFKATCSFRHGDMIVRLTTCVRHTNYIIGYVIRPDDTRVHIEYRVRMALRQLQAIVDRGF